MSLIPRHLVILSCSKNKIQFSGNLPAIERYDGSAYHVLRSYLRDSTWPEPLSIGILSAKYGLIGGLTPIENYEQRMSRSRAEELRGSSTQTLLKWGQSHQQVSFVLGKDYLHAIDFELLKQSNIQSTIINGSIGIKLHQLHDMLHNMKTKPRQTQLDLPKDRTVYFLPDWDDMLDTSYNFQTDKFSNPVKSARQEIHCVTAMQPNQICDGVLVSLAQHFGSKGILRRFEPTDLESLAPEPIKKTFGLSSNQWIFGDCGAFTYINEPSPTISVEQAISLYQVYGFDLGASVDHIPVPEAVISGKKISLSDSQRRSRIELTRSNAAAFLALHKQRKCSFTPVGVIQGLSPDDYAKQISEYVEMGYTHIALGGLVPLGDSAILETAQVVGKACKNTKQDIWVHLFGVFRPKIQAQLKEAGINSFDSATYFRKSWLRSDQNYLGTDKNWYAAIRVPITSDPRTRIRLQASGLSLQSLEVLEHAALKALHEYGNRQRDIESTLQLVTQYDAMLMRGSEHQIGKLISAYRRTLEMRPWEMCQCSACTNIGIDVLIFRGYNRNKRRGAHNTLMLFQSLNQH